MDTKEVAPVARRKPPAAGRGRVKGTPNKTTTAVREAILEAFERAGGVEYLATVATTDPKTFCTLLGKVLPLQVTGEGGAPIAFKVTLGGDT